MRWLAATVALLCVSAALVVGVYLRDRDPSSWLPPPRVAASQDAVTIMRAIHCPSALCSYRLARSPRPNHWVAKVSIGTTRVCFDIDLFAFDVTAARALSGTRPVSCRSVNSLQVVSGPKRAPVASADAGA
jgi:hypothetical protein